MAIRVGCGSWTDDAYVGVLYPPKLPKKDRLSLYAQWFERVEVNSSYYALPKRDVVAGWVKQTPEGFLFDVKLPKAFSERPADAAESDLADALRGVTRPLAEAKKLGAFLLTLAPSFGPERHRLMELDVLAERLRPFPIAVELRHRGWVEGEALTATLGYFRRRQLAWVALDLPRIEAPAILPPIDEVTDPRLAYMRAHGRNPHYARAKSAEERHAYDYAEGELREIATRAKALAKAATDVHVSLNNHAKDFAPKAAIALRRLLGQPVRDTPPEKMGGEQMSLLE